MINYYQPYLHPFLKFSKNLIPEGITQEYFHSFEDGLWKLVDNKFPNTKLVILLPNFYCSDVLDNIKIRGHKYIYYPLDENFQIYAATIKKYLWLYKPDIIIIFNACGIRSVLFSEISWLKELKPKTVIIEDNVHRLTDPAKAEFVNDRHVILDSLRKVSPIPGSRMVGKSKFMEHVKGNKILFSGYVLMCLYYYGLFRLSLRLGFCTHSASIIKAAHEKLLRKHDDLIGDSQTPYSGMPVFLPLINRFNYQNISKTKTEQVKCYEKYFCTIYRSKSFYHIHLPERDWGELHVYPLGFNQKPDNSLTKYLQSRNIPVWYKFTDTPWSQKRGVLFLPLGFHMNENKIRELSTVISDWSAQFDLKNFRR